MLGAIGGGLGAIGGGKAGNIVAELILSPSLDELEREKKKIQKKEQVLRQFGVQEAILKLDYNF